MSDAQFEKVVKLLEEIRDLTKGRNEKVDSFLHATREKAEEAVSHHQELQKVAKKRFYVALAAVFLLGLMLFIVTLLLMMPRQ
jgi:type VI protein secretion system component VasF